MKKTNRKNKINQMVNWPKNIFTIEELHAHNSDFIEITLRDHIKKARANNLVNEVGQLHNGKGRPRLVFVYGVITQDHIAEAKSRGVILKDELSVNVMSIHPTSENKSVIVDKVFNILDNNKVKTTV